MNGGGGGDGQRQRHTETETETDREPAETATDRQMRERGSVGAFGQPYILFMIFGLSKQLVFSD